MYNSLMIKFLAARCPFFSGRVMAPFPEVMLRVRFGRQQIFYNGSNLKYKMH